MLVQAAWAAIKTEGRLQARYRRLVCRLGGRKPGRGEKAILAIARTLLKIAYEVLRSGEPYEDLGSDFYSRRESPGQHRARCGSWMSSARASRRTSRTQGAASRKAARTKPLIPVTVLSARVLRCYLKWCTLRYWPVTCGCNTPARSGGSYRAPRGRPPRNW